MPIMKSGSKTISVVNYTWTAVELLACLGIKIGAQDGYWQYSVNMTDKGLEITVTTTEIDGDYPR